MKKADIMPFNKWAEKAKRLGSTYKNTASLDEACIKTMGKNYYGIMTGHDAAGRFVIQVFPMNYFEGGVVNRKENDRPHVARDFPTYVAVKGKYLTRVDTGAIVGEMISILKAHVGEKMVTDLLMDALYDQDVEVLLDQYERLQKKKAKVSTHPGCFKIAIGGKPGPVSELVIR